MANELTKVDGVGVRAQTRTFTVASGTAISQGTLLKLSDPRTASQATAINDPIAGIAAMDKEGSAGGDASTTISVWIDGVFKAVASGNITIGAPLGAGGSTAEPNKLSVQTSDAASGAAVIGYSLETATNDETFQARIRL